MSDAKRESIGRRDFLKHAAAGAALAAGGKRLVDAAAPADTSKILNYHENMEYRRLGKTDLWVSAVCLGGHWKRLQVAMGPGHCPAAGRGHGGVPEEPRRRGQQVH